MTEEVKSSKWSSRKLAVAVGGAVLATGMLYLGEINADQWVDLVKWIAGPYLVAQAVVDRGR